VALALGQAHIVLPMPMDCSDSGTSHVPTAAPTRESEAPVPTASERISVGNSSFG